VSVVTGITASGSSGDLSMSTGNSMLGAAGATSVSAGSSGGAGERGGSRRDSSQDEDRQGGKPVVGFGSELPAFLTRPTNSGQK
jgi:hypothetical protein